MDRATGEDQGQQAILKPLDDARGNLEGVFFQWVLLAGWTQLAEIGDQLSE